MQAAHNGCSESRLSCRYTTRRWHFSDASRPAKAALHGTFPRPRGPSLDYWSRVEIVPLAAGPITLAAGFISARVATWTQPTLRVTLMKRTR